MPDQSHDTTDGDDITAGEDTPARPASAPIAPSEPSLATGEPPAVLAAVITASGAAVVAGALTLPGTQSAEGASARAPSAPGTFAAAYEHPAVTRFCHWLNAIALVIMIMSGLQIFMAFPSFGPKVPERIFLTIPTAARLGGWLGGALQWHLTFMWVFIATGVIYVVYELASGHYKMTLFKARDIPGVWPMVRHYFLFGPKPPQTEAYNALQKLAYTTIVLCGALSVVTGLVIYRPVQLSGLAWLMGGFHYARIWHFIAMCGFLAFIPGHLVMVALHGWNNFTSMLTGWKKNPEYLDR